MKFYLQAPAGWLVAGALIVGGHLVWAHGREGMDLLVAYLRDAGWL